MHAQYLHISKLYYTLQYSHVYVCSSPTLRTIELPQNSTNHLKHMFKKNANSQQTYEKTFNFKIHPGKQHLKLQWYKNIQVTKIFRVINISIP